MSEFNRPGILPCQSIEALIATGAIASDTPFDADQVQPASLDLRLGGRAWRVRASFLPGKSTVRDRIRHLFTRNKKKSEEKPKTSLAHRLWNKYGVIGLGFIGTMTVGAPASLAVGISMGASTKKLVTWCCLGVITRCTLFTTIGHFGVQLF